MRTMQIVEEATRTCPCCGESHAVQERVVERRIAAGVVPARYFYCANADEYFEDHELAAWNAQQAMAAPQVFFTGAVPPWGFQQQEVNGHDGRGNEGAQAV